MSDSTQDPFSQNRNLVKIHTTIGEIEELTLAPMTDLPLLSADELNHLRRQVLAGEEIDEATFCRVIQTYMSERLDAVKATARAKRPKKEPKKQIDLSHLLQQSIGPREEEEGQ